MIKKSWLSAVLIFALMSMGIGYAMWNQEFSVATNITTGNLHFDLEVCEDSKNHSPYTSISFDESSPEWIRVNIEDAYPGATYNYDVKITNNGTMPIKPSHTYFETYEEVKEHVHVVYDTKNLLPIKPNESLTIPVEIAIGHQFQALNEQGERQKVEFSQTFQFILFNQKQIEVQEILKYRVLNITTDNGFMGLGIPTTTAKIEIIYREGGSTIETHSARGRWLGSYPRIEKTITHYRLHHEFADKMPYRVDLSIGPNDQY